MDINYKNSTVKKQCTMLRQAKKDFSEKIARKLLSRIEFIKAAENLESIINFTVLHFHGLDGKRKGQYAIDIDGRTSPYRLILQFDGYSKVQVFSEARSITTIKITEVSKHYE